MKEIPCALLNKKVNFNKTETKWKMENATRFLLENWSFWFNSHEYWELKIKLCWFIARKRKRRAFFLTLMSSGNFQKTLLHTLFCLFLKSSNRSESIKIAYNTTKLLCSPLHSRKWAETLPFLNIPHQEIRWNYGILHSVLLFT